MERGRFRDEITTRDVSRTFWCAFERGIFRIEFAVGTRVLGWYIYVFEYLTRPELTIRACGDNKNERLEQGWAQGLKDPTSHGYMQRLAITCTFTQSHFIPRNFTFYPNRSLWTVNEDSFSCDSTFKRIPLLTTKFAHSIESGNAKRNIIYLQRWTKDRKAPLLYSSWVAIINTSTYPLCLRHRKPKRSALHLT